MMVALICLLTQGAVNLTISPLTDEVQRTLVVYFLPGLDGVGLLEDRRSGTVFGAGFGGGVSLGAEGLGIVKEKSYPSRLTTALPWFTCTSL